VALKRMATSFVSFHITSHTKGFSATLVRTLEGFFARMTVTVDAKTARPRERFLACLADITVLGLREASLRRRRDVMMMLPRIGTTRRGQRDRDWHYRWWRKLL